MGLKKLLKITAAAGVIIAVGLGLTLAAGKLYQHLDRDPDRGAIAVPDTAFGDGYNTPVYLPSQGWSAADSLWFYNTTQGSALMPYAFFVALEQPQSNELFLAPTHIDQLRYLPQKPTLFNPDGLPVGFVQETYRGRDYVGFTCAACHTAQINYGKTALRIDGGPAMANMPLLLDTLVASMEATLKTDEKLQRFIARVKRQDYYYFNDTLIKSDLIRWRDTLKHYNQVNHSSLEYGYGRLDAFGRIYNRVLQHVINKPQLAWALSNIADDNNHALLTPAQIAAVTADLGDTIIGDAGFAQVIARLQSHEPGMPALNAEQMHQVKKALFNEPNAPVSYPYLWDITRSDYVQWNALANNAGLGGLGRNVGEVIGVFAKLDWQAKPATWSLAAWLSNQSHKQQQIDFKSSVDGVNLQRLERHLGSLRSPLWPEAILGALDPAKIARGERLYARLCQSCHARIDRSDAERLITAQVSGLGPVGTDPAMARNSVNYTGFSGNFVNTYLNQDVGTLVVPERAPVVEILTTVTRGVVATPDDDKFWMRRQLDRMYMFAGTFFDNPIKANIKHGDYTPDTTAAPFNSLLAYKARPLNGIWATAPYLHNGSVPSLYHLLLPKKRPGDPDTGEYRPEQFLVGSREFKPDIVGFETQGYPGTRFDVTLPGNGNEGHEYGTMQASPGQPLKPLSPSERLDLLEFLKSL